MNKKENEFSELLKQKRVKSWEPVLWHIMKVLSHACADVLYECDDPLDLEIRLKIDRAEMKGVVMSSSYKRKYAKDLRGQGFPFLMQMKV